MNIQHELIKMKLNGEKDISLALIDKLSEIAFQNKDIEENVELDDFDYYEINMPVIKFYFVADFLDEDSNWRHERSMWIVLEYNGNYSKPIVQRKWSE